MKAIQMLQNWVRVRPTLDINSSATWFLLSFIYIQAMDSNETGFHFSMIGLLPTLKIPGLILTMVFVCLAIAAVILIEPILLLRWSEWTRKIRRPLAWEYFFSFNVLTAFVFGFLSGIAESIEKLVDSPWLINLVAVLGFCIFLAMIGRSVLLAGKLHLR